jgi:hypothetical protein
VAASRNPNFARGHRGLLCPPTMNSVRRAFRTYRRAARGLEVEGGRCRSDTW